MKKLSKEATKYILACKLERDAFEIFDMNKNEPIEDIIRQLRERFGSFPSKSDYEEQHTSFARQNNEPIKSCMNRYQYIIKNLYKNDPNINNIIEELCSEKVKKVAHPDARIHLERAEQQHSKLDYKSRLQIIHREEDLLRQNGISVPPKINQLYANNEEFESEDEDSESEPDSDQDEFIPERSHDNPNIHSLHYGHAQGQGHNQVSYEDEIDHPPQHFEEDAPGNYPVQQNFNFQQPSIEFHQNYHQNDSNRFMNSVQPSQMDYDQLEQHHNQHGIGPQEEIEPCNEVEEQDQMEQNEIEPTQEDIINQPQQQFYSNTDTTPEQDLEENPPHEVDQTEDIEPECHTSSPMDVAMLYEKVGNFVNEICSSPDNENKIHKIVSLFLADPHNTFKTTN